MTELREKVRSAISDLAFALDAANVSAERDDLIREAADAIMALIAGVRADFIEELANTQAAQNGVIECPGGAGRITLATWLRAQEGGK